MDGGSKEKVVSGTTLRVYRVLYREGKPQSVNEIQKKANLSTPSLAYYHLNKLVDHGLAKEKDGGYVVDRVIFENMIRVGRSLIPLQATFTAFFATVIIGLVVLLRSYASSSPGIFLFALITNCISCAIFAYQTVMSFRQYHL